MAVNEDLKQQADDLFIALGFTVSDHAGFCAKAPTGEPYDTMTCMGARLQGTREDPKSVPETIDECHAAYLKRLMEAAQGKTGTVYWRHPPIVERQYGLYNVYSRLLISDKPIIPEFLDPDSYAKVELRGLAAQSA